ncbi:MFS transporter [Paraflavisolibacter sp. H34]|uniref:MFS transporter n=1 Tax=Huijunlia imazamoxiresistens TaxID=3127457 RepID=UPI003016123D
MNVFRSLKYRNFKLFFFGQSVSLLGTWMQKTAVSWLVYRLTGSALLLGIVSFVSLIPSLLLSPYAGSYIDRHDRFRVLVKTQVISMLQAGALATLLYFRVYHMGAIVFLSLVQGVINAFDVTCRQSLMIEMVDQKEDLPNAIALNSTMTNFARLAGPALAGFVLSTLGEDVCFLSNFFSYIPVLACLSLMQLNTGVKAAAGKDIWTELKEGFRYVSSDRNISGLILLLGVNSLLVIPFATLLPIFAKDLFQGTAQTFSYFESAIGLGSVFGAVYLAQLKRHDRLIRTTMLASALFATGVAGLSAVSSLPLALAALILGGSGMMAFTSSINTYIQVHSEPHMRGRAISYFVMAYQGIIPVGSLLIGWLAHYLGPREAVALEGITGLALTACYFFYHRQAEAGSALKKLAENP